MHLICSHCILEDDSIVIRYSVHRFYADICTYLELELLFNSEILLGFLVLISNGRAYWHCKGGNVPPLSRVSIGPAKS